MSNAVFPNLPGLAWSVFKTPQWSTRVQRSTGGNELRASYFSQPIWKWRLTYELLRESAGLSELKQLVSFYNARQGMYDSFLYSDPSDSSVANHLFGLGDGVRTIFQLQRTSGPNSLPRTNLLAVTEDWSNSPWSGVNITAATDAAVASNGTLTADAIIETAAVSVEHYLQQTFVAPNSSLVALSIDAQYLGRNLFLGCVLRDAVSVAGAYFNLATGTIISTSGGVTSRMTAKPGGIYRCAITVNVGTGASNPQARFETHDSILGLVFTGDVTKGAILWGAQAETTNAIETAYIPNPTSSPLTVGAALYPGTADAFEPVYNVNGPPKIYVNGVLKLPNTDYSISNGLVTFLTGAPVNGSYVTWTGNYYWRARFDLDAIDFEQFMYQLWKAQTVSFVSVKGS